MDLYKYISNAKLDELAKSISKDKYYRPVENTFYGNREYVQLMILKDVKNTTALEELTSASNIKELIATVGDLIINQDTSVAIDTTTVDVTRKEKITLNGNTLTLDNTTLGSTACFTLCDDSAELVIENGTINLKSGKSPLAMVKSGKLVLNNVKITLPEDSSSAGAILMFDRATQKSGDEKDIEVVLSNCSIGGYTGVNIKGGKLTMTNCTVTAKDFAVLGNGSAGLGKTDISLNSCNFKCAGNEGIESAAIYHPQDGKLTITNGTYEGDCALYVKSGNVKVFGGTFRALQEEAKSYTYWANGCHTTGDVVINDVCNYPGENATLTISGGTFESALESACDVATYIYTPAHQGTKPVYKTIVSNSLNLTEKTETI